VKQRRPSSINAKTKISCIEEMDALLDQIVDFKKLIRATENISNPDFKQEYRLFKQHVEWVIEDLGASNYIVAPKEKNADSKLLDSKLLDSTITG